MEGEVSRRDRDAFHADDRHARTSANHRANDGTIGDGPSSNIDPDQRSPTDGETIRSTPTDGEKHHKGPSNDARRVKMDDV